MLKWPDSEAEAMKREFPKPPLDSWYEERKWPKGWSVLGDLQGQAVLDVGCHTGWLGWLAKECGAEVWASDIFGTAVHPSLYFVHAMKEDLPYADGMFDQVITANVLHHGELKPALKEIARVLKSGGRFTTFQEPVIPPWITEQEELKKSCAEELKRGIDERRYHAWEYQQALEKFFSKVEVWRCHGSPLMPDEHNWDATTWGELETYHGGIGVSCIK